MNFRKIILINTTIYSGRIVFTNGMITLQHYTGGINMNRVRVRETNSVDTNEWSPWVIKLHSRADQRPYDTTSQVVWHHIARGKALPWCISRQLQIVGSLLLSRIGDVTPATPDTELNVTTNRTGNDSAANGGVAATGEVSTKVKGTTQVPVPIEL